MLAVWQPASPSIGGCGSAWAYLCASMSDTDKSIADNRIANLYDPGYRGRDGNGRRYLGNGEQISPEEGSADNLLRHDDHIARIQASPENVRPIPFTRSPSNDGTVGTDDKDLFAIRNIVGSSR